MPHSRAAPGALHGPTATPIAGGGLCPQGGLCSLLPCAPRHPTLGSVGCSPRRLIWQCAQWAPLGSCWGCAGLPLAQSLQGQAVLVCPRCSLKQLWEYPCVPFGGPLLLRGLLVLGAALCCSQHSPSAWPCSGRIVLWLGYLVGQWVEHLYRLSCIFSCSEAQSWEWSLCSTE